MTTLFLSIILTLVPIFGIMFVGAVAERKKILPKNATMCLNQFVYWFGLPMLLFYLLASSSTEHMHVESVLGCALALACIQVFTLFLLRMMKRSWKDSMQGSLITSFPNVAFMGIPIILLLYPNNAEAKIMAGFTAMVPTLSFVVADVFLSVCNATQEQSTKTIHCLGRSLLTNPAIWSISLGLLVLLAEIPLPQSLLEISKMLGATASPCALFCMGMVLSAQLASWKQGVKIVWTEQTILLGIKLFLTPFVVYSISMALGAQGIGLATMTVMCATPSAITCHIIAIKHDAMVDGCANAVLFGTVLSVFTLPFIIATIQWAMRPI